MTAAPFAITRFFDHLSDPRIDRHKKHLLVDIIVSALCAVISGAKDWQQIATFTRSRLAWLKTFLALPNCAPSHDTYERVFDRLDSQAFLACFQRWVDALARGLGIPHIAIDGKTLRHSGRRTIDLGPLHVVSAWATDCQLTLGQVAVEAKSNEITAIPQLLDLLDLHGALVTIDAMGCQKAIASQIVAGGGDFVLAVKDNQPHLLEDMHDRIGAALDGRAGIDYQIATTHDCRHGRAEERTYVIVTEWEPVRNQDEWANLRVLGMCTRRRTVQGKASEETHYFIGSRLADVQTYARAVRGHWGVENNLHWQLDIAFGEDANRVQKRNGAANLALVRRLALSLLKKQPSRASLRCKQFRASLDTDFLEEILLGGLNLGAF